MSLTEKDLANIKTIVDTSAIGVEQRIDAKLDYAIDVLERKIDRRINEVLDSVRRSFDNLEEHIAVRSLSKRVSRLESILSPDKSI